MSTNRSLAERLFAAFLSLVLVLGIFPVGAVRTSAEETAAPYGSVSALTEGLSVSGDGTQEITVTNDNLILNWVAADTSIGRNKDGWWVGIKLTAPAGMTAAQLQSVKYGYTNTKEAMTKSFWDNKDSEDEAQSHYIGLWGFVDENSLQEGVVTKNWYISWDGTTTNAQHIQLNLDPNKIVLKDAQGNGVYPVYGTVVPATQGLTVTGNGTEAVSLTNNDIILNWVAADTSIGRNQDGWWVGINLYAPAGMTAEQLQKVMYGYTKEAMTKSFWSNKDSADNAESHYIGLWRRIDETYLEKDTVTCDWYFEWSETNVQHIQLELDPSKVTLKDQAECGLGTVTAITPENTTISGTSHITAVVEEAELTYVEADGREAGWWVGIKAVAPEGFTENAKYAYVTNGVTGEAKSFNTDKNGDNYIELWLKVTDESLETERNDSTADKKLAMNYAFDWNGNGFYEQTIEFYVKADGNIVLKNAAGQQVYPYFHGEVSTDIGTAEIENNKTAEVTVDLNGYEILWNEGWKASVKASLAGYEDVTIAQIFQSAEETVANTTQQIDWNDDGLPDQTVVLTGKVKLLKAEQVKPVLENAAVGIDSSVLLAQGGSNAVTNTDNAVGALSYTIAENNFLTIDETTGRVTVAEGKWITLLKELAEKESFAVEVTATFAETDTHNAAYASYVLTINPKTDDSLAFDEESVSKIYGGQDGKPYTYKQVPSSEDGVIDTVEYESSDGTVATVVEDGTVTFVKAGDVTITATVTYKAGYTVTTASYELSISKGEQAPLTFMNSDTEITYNDNSNIYTNAVSGGTTGNAVVYEIVSGEGVAEIADSSKPELTIKTSGTVTVKATMPGNDCYNDVSATYTLVINKAAQEIQLDENAATVKNSAKEYTIGMVPTDGWYSLNKQFTFEITKADATAAGTTVDPTSGVVTIDEGDYGEVKILVTRPGDDCFQDWSGETFTLTIEQIDANPANFAFAGEKHRDAEDGEWYCGPVTITYEADGVKYQVSEETQKNDQWFDSYTISEDGEYQPVLSVKSTQEHGGIHYALEVGTVKIDRTAPKSTIEYGPTVWGDVFETLTFGFYDAETMVKITADDRNGNAEVSGVSAIYYKLAGDTEYKPGELRGNAIVIPIPDQYIGQVEFYAVDKAGNVEGENTSATTIVVDSSKAAWEVDYAYDFDAKTDSGEAVYTDDNGIQYTRFDTTVTLSVKEKFFDLSLEELLLTENGTASAAAPEIKGDDSRSEWTEGENDTWSIDLTLNSEGVHDMSMEYQNRSKLDSDKYSQKIVIDRTVPVCKIEWVEAERVVESETGNTRYYKENADKPATATLTITDANFDPAQTVVTDKIEPVDGTEKEETLKVTWKQDAEDSTIWTATVTLTEEGIHNLSVDCTDWAGNVMETKTTDVVIIDYTAPVLEELVYSGAEAKNTKDGRNYYNAATTVTVVITERNFDANDLKIDLKAVDVTGKDNGASYSAGEWKHEGDKHTIDLEFASDANFTLDVSYTDMANNAGNDVEEKLFTVDKVAPEIIGISYSKSLQDVVIDKITFSYYKAPVEVTLKVKDVTAGVLQFDYSALLNENVSKVNAAIEDAKIENVTQDGTTFSVTFKVPAEALNKENQFNGFVQFTATDLSGNVSAQESHKEFQSLVVDNITPKVTVTYNAPVQRLEDVSYYDGDITVTIAIDEANFFGTDVEITATKNGAAYPVTINGWTGGNGDIHTGVFGLEQDGDYIISIKYTDRSGNEMTEYTSNQLTLDTTLPAVEVTNVVANSANTDEVYTFDITASDINIDADSFKPVLTGVFRNKDGKFETRTISMGNVKVVKKNETYSFTVENLEEDAIYTLTCSVKDLAGNTYEKMVLKDEKEYDEVQFSINRNGSTYMLDDNTMGLVDDYYVQNVDNDVVLIEINPDVLENHSVSLNGKDLTEGTDYKVTDEGGNGSWMKYTYRIDKNLMADESEYMLVVSSEDKAGNKAFSDVKGANINFVVDRTAPVVTVTGMHNDGRYQVESQTVTLIPMDAGGALNALSVYLVDDDGNVLEQLINLSGENLYNALEEGDGQITFEIGEGLYQNVRVVCTDMAVDADGDTNAYDETFTNISVSTSGFMIFWANKRLRYGVIFGLLGLIALIIFVIVGNRKKKAAKG